MTMPVITSENAMRRAIRKLPGSTGWWHCDGEDTYNELADKLTEHGFTFDEAVDLLGSAYSAAAGEFGA